MKFLTSKAIHIVLISLLANSTVIYAREQQGGNIDVGKFKSNVTADNITQVTVGNDNESKTNLGGIDTEGKAKIGKFETNVAVKNVTQATIGNKNKSSMTIGGVSSK